MDIKILVNLIDTEPNDRYFHIRDELDDIEVQIVKWGIHFYID